MDEAQEFTEFYQATWARTVTCAFSVAGELGAAEEAAQEAYARAWQRWSKLSTYDDPATWVRKVAVRQAISGWRRRRTALQHLTTTRPPDPAPPPDADTIALTAALDHLPPNQRRVVLLHHLAGLSVTEIARLEQRPQGTIKTRLFRGRAALVSLLDGTGNAGDLGSSATTGSATGHCRPRTNLKVGDIGDAGDMIEGRPRHA